MVDFVRRFFMCLFLQFGMRRDLSIIFNEIIYFLLLNNYFLTIINAGCRYLSKKKSLNLSYFIFY